MKDDKDRGFVCKPHSIDWKNCEMTGLSGSEFIQPYQNQ
jgi:hypothetical protein